MEVAFTDRHGGASGGSFASLNLALVGGDDPEAVHENHRRVGAEFNDGGPLVGMHQVHGSSISVIEASSTSSASVLVPNPLSFGT